MTEVNCHLLRDIMSCSLLFDKEDRRVDVASVALSARSCERNSSNLPSDRQIATAGFSTQVSRNTYSLCHKKKGVVTNSFTYQMSDQCLCLFDLPTHNCKHILLDYHWLIRFFF